MNTYNITEQNLQVEFIGSYMRSYKFYIYDYKHENCEFKYFININI